MFLLHLLREKYILLYLYGFVDFSILICWGFGDVLGGQFLLRLSVLMHYSYRYLDDPVRTHWRRNPLPSTHKGRKGGVCILLHLPWIPRYKQQELNTLWLPVLWDPSGNYCGDIDLSPARPSFRFRTDQLSLTSCMEQKLGHSWRPWQPESMDFIPVHLIQWRLSNGTSEFLIRYSGNTHTTTSGVQSGGAVPDAIVWPHTEMSS